MKKHKRAVEWLVVVAVLATIVVGLQIMNNAYRGEFADNPDEPAHVVTGLMVRDYFLHGLSSRPMKFAENFYEHYPKVAIGHWPPVFYVAQTVWTVVFPPGRASLMIFMALVSVLFALTIYVVCRELCGGLPAFCAALFFVCLPVVQKYTGMVMNDMFGAWLVFIAAAWFGKFIETEKWFYSVAFGAAASLSILTRGGSLSLGLVPALAVLLAKRFSLLKKWSFWMPLMIVGVLCGPWYWFSFDMMKDGFENPQGIASSLRALAFYFPGMLRLSGAAFFIMALTGFFVKVVFPENSAGRYGMWVSLGAMMISVPLFHCIVTNAFDTRYLIPAMPGVAVFAVAGIQFLGRRLSRIGVRPALCTAFVAGLMIMSFVKFTFRFEDSRNTGFKAAVSAVMQSDFDVPVWLISSDAIGEGGFIVNAALKEQRPGHTLLRSSKELASSAWDGSGYELLYKTPEQMRDFVVSGPAGLVIADYSVPRHRLLPHNILLENALETFPGSFRLVAFYPCIREGVFHEKGIRVYEVARRKDGDGSVAD